MKFEPDNNLIDRTFCEKLFTNWIVIIAATEIRKYSLPLFVWKTL